MDVQSDQKKMPEFLMVFCTCGSEGEALSLARASIDKRVAACVNILPAVQSVYQWEGQIETASEYLLLAKTTVESFPDLREMLLERHSYENPEVVAVPITNGADKYLAWVRSSTSRASI